MEENSETDENSSDENLANLFGNFDEISEISEPVNEPMEEFQVKIIKLGIVLYEIRNSEGP